MGTSLKRHKVKKPTANLELFKEGQDRNPEVRLWYKMKSGIATERVSMFLIQAFDVLGQLERGEWRREWRGGEDGAVGSRSSRGAAVSAVESESLDFSTTDSSPGLLQLVHTHQGQTRVWAQINNSTYFISACFTAAAWHAHGSLTRLLCGAAVGTRPA
ncbi:unnamed protein product [Pleuronectes platessa]|uniref:Uncharacterized protein n=1 Tax=Pleuronectes platessa TaxID=8262 RepID=A0A9N7U9D5_PLEPL|nr:unnamed protein product [Pleuronectes platessa]